MAKVKKAQFGKGLMAKTEADKQYTRKMFKTADSLRSAKISFGKDMEKQRSANRAKADSLEKAVEKRVGVPRKKNLYEQKNGGKTKAKRVKRK